MTWFEQVIGADFNSVIITLTHRGLIWSYIYDPRAVVRSLLDLNIAENSIGSTHGMRSIIELDFSRTKKCEWERRNELGWENLLNNARGQKNGPRVQMWSIDIWAIHAGKIPSEFTWVSSSDEFSWYALTHAHLIRKCILIWLENAWCHNHSSEISLHSATERDNESDNLCNCS